MRNFLINIDFNEEQTNFLINQALELANQEEVKIWLLHVAAPNPDFVGHEVGPQYIRDARADELRQEHRLIQQYAGQLQDKGYAADGLLIPGATVDTIEEEAEKLAIDLIIMGHHDHNLLYRAFFGSTPLQLMRKTKVPILVFPLEEEEE
jgi:nucleotide-binding universal stress UspA family protein